VTDRLWSVEDLVAAEGGKSGVIYLKSILAGLLAVVAAAILLVFVVAVRLWVASRSSQTGAVGWDPISLAKPWAWLTAVLAVFLVGFFWEFCRLSSK
jgi:preprotein translocase subunit SecY